MSNDPTIEQERPVLDSFLKGIVALSIVLGMTGALIGSGKTMALSGAVQLGFFLGTSVFALVCTFAPNRTLTHPKIASIIGTKNPVVARVVCLIAAVVLGALAGIPLIAIFVAK